MTDDDFAYVSVWKCPNCGITTNATDMFIPKTTEGVYICSHCKNHGEGEHEMEVLEYDD